MGGEKGGLKGHPARRRIRNMFFCNLLRLLREAAIGLDGAWHGPAETDVTGGIGECSHGETAVIGVLQVLSG